eukprot:2803977-Rhodomonas_salina.2
MSNQVHAITFLAQRTMEIVAMYAYHDGQAILRVGPQIDLPDILVDHCRTGLCVRNERRKREMEIERGGANTILHGQGRGARWLGCR